MSTQKRKARPKSKPARYLVVVERTRAGFRAHAPDAPECSGVGKTRAVAVQRVVESLTQHFEALRARGEALPVPRADALFLELVTK